MDRFLVDPSKLYDNKGYQQPDFKLILAFNECNMPESQIKENDDWEYINKFIMNRSIVFKAEQDGKVDHKYGVDHLFADQGDDDYEVTVQQGADESIYGRYKDIENLGSDVQVADNVDFKASSVKM